MKPPVSVLPLLLAFTLLTPRHPQQQFNWQTLEMGMLKVHWYQGDAKFGQEALDISQAGLRSVNAIVPVDLEQPIELFVYSNLEDLHSELAPESEKWVAGHADPALGVIRVVIEPGVEQGRTMEQRIPHELMHVMLYRRVGAGYHNIPAWLREGLATLAETYPNAEYERVLADAAVNEQLIPLGELCDSFPAESGRAFLGYAESRSFTNYLRETYSSAGLLTLAAAYAGGMDCERGTESAFGISLSSLEMKWRSSVLSQNTFLSFVESTFPYWVLLCLVLIVPLIGIITAMRRKEAS